MHSHLHPVLPWVCPHIHSNWTCVFAAPYLQDDAVLLLLRYPFLASTSKQLLHLAGLLEDLPAATGISKAELQAVLVQHPVLARYSSTAALAGKLKALRSLFPGEHCTQAVALFCAW